MIAITARAFCLALPTPLQGAGRKRQQKTAARAKKHYTQLRPRAFRGLKIVRSSKMFNRRSAGGAQEPAVESAKSLLIVADYLT